MIVVGRQTVEMISAEIRSSFSFVECIGIYSKTVDVGI